MPVCWLHYRFFFSACQNVSQSEPSKTTILPEGASDGFANNSDQPKGGGKNIISITHFSKTVNFNLEDSVSFFFPPSPPTKPNPTLKRSLLQDEKRQGRANAEHSQMLNILLTVFYPREAETSLGRTFVEKEPIPLGCDGYCEDTNTSHHTLASVLIAF